MTSPKGSSLFVNVGPSEARRRLKGFGHGVRKIQSAGRNQAVVTHTATGRHLKELQQVFADVGFSGTETGLDEPIDNLRNLGPTSATWLRDVGIKTIADLERISPAAVYRLVKQKQPGASLNLLWAMAAGLLDRDWQTLSDDERAKLKRAAEED